MKKFIIILFCLIFVFSPVAFADKWNSESTGLESKAQLYQHRVHLWMGLCSQNDLDLRLYAIWTEADKTKAEQLWDNTLTYYNQRKNKLRQEIKKLSEENKTKYFQEIGVQKQDEDDWLN